MTLGDSVVSERLGRAQVQARARDVDLLLVTPSADLRYLTGHAGHSSERLTVLIVPDEGTAILLAPSIETPGIVSPDGVRLVPWTDGQDPFEMIIDFLPSGASPRTIAVSEQTWAGVLLRLQALFPNAAFESATPLMRNLRIIKSAEELDLLAEAGRRADSAFTDLAQLRFAGRTEREVAATLSDLLHSTGLGQADWGPIVGSGPNGASPHHVASEREIHEGDAVVLDFGGTLDGYQADITRTVHVGTPGDEFRRAYATVKAAQEAGVAAARPGRSAGSVDDTVRQIINRAGYGEFFIHRTGHGLGLEAHEEPYLLSGNELSLAAGMVFSVEPGVYFPGRFGIRIEDSVAATEAGPLRLNQADRSLIVVH